MSLTFPINCRLPERCFVSDGEAETLSAVLAHVRCPSSDPDAWSEQQIVLPGLWSEVVVTVTKELNVLRRLLKHSTERDAFG
jgi:hypothetical protein